MEIMVVRSTKNKEYAKLEFQLAKGQTKEYNEHKCKSSFH